MKKYFKTLSVSLLLALGLVGSSLPNVLAASTPELYGSPTQITANANREFRVPVRLNAHDVSVDTVSVMVHFPAAQMTFVRVDKAGSYFDTTVPAAPSADNGTVNFSVASLGAGPTKTDVLVSTLIFSTKLDSGSATVDFNGSQAAHAGQPISLQAGTVKVNFAAATNDTAGTPAISNIIVSNITVNSGIVRWHTDVAATSSVDYGTSTQYGFTAGSVDLVTEHSVQLDKVFAGKSVVHFSVTSTTADAQSNTSKDQSFLTRGYTIKVTVANKDGDVLKNADVQVANLPVVKTNDNGIATIENVAPGNQKVVVNGGEGQFIAVKALKAANATDVQDFKVTAESKTRPFVFIFAGIVVILLIVALITKRNKTNKA